MAVVEHPVAEQEEFRREVLRLINEDRLIERLRGFWCCERLATRSLELPPTTELGLRVVEVVVRNGVCLAVLQVDAVAVEAPGSAPRVDDSQVVPIGFLASLLEG